MKTLIAGFLIAAVLASPSLSPEVDALLTSSVSDFKTYEAGVADVRAVFSGTLPGDAGHAPAPIICGQFLPVSGEAKAWTDFATIKTGAFEQWLGGSATAYCARAKIEHTPESDLTADMRERLGLK